MKVFALSFIEILIIIATMYEWELPHYLKIYITANKISSTSYILITVYMEFNFRNPQILIVEILGSALRNSAQL